MPEELRPAESLSSSHLKSHLTFIDLLLCDDVVLKYFSLANVLGFFFFALFVSWLCCLFYLIVKALWEVWFRKCLSLAILLLL